MKKFKLILIFLLISILMVGCRTTKKIIDSSSKIEQSIEENKTVNSNELEKTNNDLVTVKKTTTTTTDFYPPENTSGKESDPITETGSKNKNGEENKPDKPKKGAVKSVTTTTIEETQIDKGKAEINKQKSENTNTSGSLKADENTKQKEIKKPTTPLWVWIVCVLTIGVGLFFLRKTPFFKVIEKFFKSIFTKK